jgi:tetratricopeptide (TPR) repeat protein
LSGFVVCRACGTRIKAGRGHCLKCFAPLPDSEESAPPPLSESLGLSRNVQMEIWAGATFAATLLAFTIWQTWPSRGDDVAQPADPTSVAAAPRAPAPAPAPPDTADAASRPAESSSAAASGTTPAVTDPNLDTMRADYEQKLSAQPKDPVLLNKLGEVLERMGQVDEAAARFARAVALQPLEATYRINLARAAGQLGQMQRSIDQYRAAARLRPRDYEVVNALGLALQKKGDDEAAVAEFTKARRADPAAPGAVLGLATSLEKLGRVDEAIDVFHQYLDMPASPAEIARVKEHLALLSRGRSQVK